MFRADLVLYRTFLGILLGLVFLFDILFAGVAQAALTLCLAAAATLLGVLLTVCKIIVSHNSQLQISLI